MSIVLLVSDGGAAADVEETGTRRAPAAPRARAGRKLDHSRDGVILDAALAVLAESGL